MNSKEASIPMDLMLAQQKWNEEHQDELEDEFIQRTASKRRKKTSSSNTDLDDDHHVITNKEPISSISTASTNPSDKKKEKNSSSPNDHEPSSTSSIPSSSPKTSSNNGRMGPKKSSTNKSASKARSRSSSPMANGVENRNSNTIDHNEQDETKRTAIVEDRSPSTKRRKINSRSEMTSRSDSVSLEDADEAISKIDESDMHSRSRKTGNGARSNSKKNNTNTNTNDDNESFHEDSTAPNNNSQPLSPPTTTTKKPYSKRSGDRGHNMRTGSRHSTPSPNSEGTPQPMAPAQPAAVRYPSSKMTISDMTKRAKQLLDYISRVQIDMADRKSKVGSQTPSAETPEVAGTLCNSHTQVQGQLKQQQQQKDMGMNEDPTVFHLPASASSIIHGDSQVCPDLSRSSMESTASSIDGLHEPSSPVDTKVPINDMISKEMTIKVVPMNSRSTPPLLSTPPLSVHDHHHHQHQRHPSGTPESESTHEPLTPPHQPVESDEQQKTCSNELTSSSSVAIITVEAQSTTVTSLDLMDKLTGDLIRFQERFGAYV
ncbi:hypothetical protein BGZ49_002356 [Haplosporangium sp. Z 27]|nr:hypothetical protein BGZ49_002356 [Haplosporangium sp. Z 27]